MDSRPEWRSFELTEILRLMRLAMIEAEVPRAKIRRTFAEMKKQVRYGQPLLVELERISEN